MEAAGPTRFFGFRSFQLDVRAGELRRNGVKLRVPDQSIRVLAMLLDHPGEVITRQELHQKLWPNGTIVDFDHGLNTAINRLRQALEDSAEEPRFIETLPRRGYRFILPVEQIAFMESHVPSDPEPEAGELAGQTISHYRILKILGRGATGVVYQAEDTTLGRSVAIKFLSEELADDPQALERFAREARVASALNHPNICTVHEVSEHEDVPFIVMEYVAGKSLGQCIGAEGLPVNNVLNYAVQITDALVRAHAAGIVHRDLKPANIMISQHGLVKVLDFGLAKVRAVEAMAGATALPCEATPLTGEGAILGTLQYMAPEQLEGKEADARTDIFALGTVIYEMARGRKAFEGTSQAGLISAIMTSDPPFISTPHNTAPSPLDHVVRACLAKEPEMRWQTAHDVLVELKWIVDTGESSRDLSETYTGVSVEPVKTTTNRNRFWKCIAILAGVLLAATTALLLTRNTSQDISGYRYTPFAINPEGQSSPAWSPDGRSVTYAGRVNGHTQVFVRTLDSPESVQLTSNFEYAAAPHWSPDSKRILFFAPGLDAEAKPTMSLYSIAAVGGEPELLARLPDYQFGAEISPDNQTLVVFGVPEGGNATVFVSSPLASRFRQYEPAPFAGKGFYHMPHLRFAPNGQKLLLIRTGESGTEEGWLLPYPPGKSIPQRVLKHFPAPRVTKDFSWMPDNRHVVLALSEKGRNPDTHLWIADTESEDSYQITGGIGAQLNVAISPDGRQIIYSEAKLDLDVITVSLLDGKSKKLIATDVFERMAAWSAGTDKLAYVTDRNGPTEIWVRSADGSDHPLVTQRDFPGSPSRLFMDPVLSPDGKRVIFTRASEDATVRTWIMSLSGGAPQRLNDSANATEYAGTWSPDGRRFAELALLNSGMSLAVIKVGSREKPVILRDHVDNFLPDWSPTGEWLTFRDKSGWNLISPDGKTIKPLGKIATSYLAFSKDGKLLYGIREENDKTTLFSLDITTIKATDIHELGRHLAPASDFLPGIRLSLTADGKSITYSTQVAKSNLWILEGFRQPGLLSGLGLNWSR